ncbi:MAG: hypothetical protein M0R03_12505 [Novosphingobium sp.]|nr:hypothetical protein [Novosphingobium sp.]
MKNDKKKKDMGLKVNIVLKAIDRYTGKIKDERTIHNLIVTTGKSRVAQLINGLSVAGFKYVAIGEGAVAAALGDIALGTEQKRALATLSESPTGTAKWVYVFTFSSGESYTITEVGIFDTLTESGSTMLNRSVFAGIAVDADTDLSMSITMAVDNA